MRCAHGEPHERWAGLHRKNLEERAEVSTLRESARSRKAVAAVAQAQETADRMASTTVARPPPVSSPVKSQQQPPGATSHASDAASKSPDGRRWVTARHADRADAVIDRAIKDLAGQARDVLQKAELGELDFDADIFRTPVGLVCRLLGLQKSIDHHRTMGEPVGDIVLKNQADLRAQLHHAMEQTAPIATPAEPPAVVTPETNTAPSPQNTPGAIAAPTMTCTPPGTSTERIADSPSTPLAAVQQGSGAETQAQQEDHIMGNVMINTPSPRQTPGPTCPSMLPAEPSTVPDTPAAGPSSVSMAVTPATPLPAAAQQGSGTEPLALQEDHIMHHNMINTTPLATSSTAGSEPEAEGYASDATEAEGDNGKQGQVPVDPTKRRLMTAEDWRAHEVSGVCA